MVSAYIAELNASVEREKARRAEQDRADEEVAAQAVRERLMPVEHRLRRLLDSIPVEMQRQGLSLASVQQSLKGRSRGCAHPGEVGRALRKLGFKRERRWRGDAIGFRALWYRYT
jgi:hypothetical protein